MAHLDIDAESRIFTNVVEARKAASALGLGVLVHLLDMALVEMGDAAAKKIALDPKMPPRRMMEDGRRAN